MTHRAMSERSYHGATSGSLIHVWKHSLSIAEPAGDRDGSQ